MVGHTPEKIEQIDLQVKSVLTKLQSAINAGAGKEEIVAILKSATNYLEAGDGNKDEKEVKKFEEYLLNESIHSKLVELPGIKEGLSDAMTNISFTQAKQEYDRHMHTDRILIAKRFLIQMGSVFQNNREKKEVKKIQAQWTKEFDKAKVEYDKGGTYGVCMAKMRNYARNEKQRKIIEEINYSLKK